MIKKKINQNKESDDKPLKKDHDVNKKDVPKILYHYITYLFNCQDG